MVCCVVLQCEVRCEDQMRSWLMALCRQGFPRNCLAQQQGLTVGWWWVVVREGGGQQHIAAQKLHGSKLVLP